MFLIKPNALFLHMVPEHKTCNYKVTFDYTFQSLLTSFALLAMFYSLSFAFPLLLDVPPQSNLMYQQLLISLTAVVPSLYPS